MIKTFSQTENGPCEIGAQSIEGNNYETRQSSLDVFVPFLALTMHKTQQLFTSD